MDTTAALIALKALGQPNRLAIYRLLVQAGPASMAVGDLRDQLTIPGATLTAHLHLLRAAGLVADQREGRVIRVRADYSQMEALIDFLTENCCAGSTCAELPLSPPCVRNADFFMSSRKRVLFVCVENANRSQMAEAFARIHGGDRIEALSAGSKPSGVINPKAIRFMGELDYDLSAHTSKSLDEVTGEFAAVVTMGCGDSCPWIPAKRREDWALSDPKHMDDADYRALRDEIARRVQALLATL